MHKGETWNECERYADPVTGRAVIRLTSAGEHNNTPTYHTGTAFTAGGERLVFITRRGGLSALCVAALPSGDLTCLTDPINDDLYGSACLAVATNWCLYRRGRQVRAVHLDTLDDRIVWEGEDGWRTGMPSVDAAGRFAIVPSGPQYPALKGVTDAFEIFRYWMDHDAATARLVRVPMDGSGAATEVYREKGIGCNHVQISPVEEDLVVIDRDWPPKFSWGCDGVRNRTWALRLSSGKLTELRPRAGGPFQVHGTWTFDGELFLFHGWLGNNNGLPAVSCG
jgi:hypothetical protein